MKTRFLCNPSNPAGYAALIFFIVLLTAVARADTASGSRYYLTMAEPNAMSYSYSGRSGFKNDDISSDMSVQRFDASISGWQCRCRRSWTNLGASFAFGMSAISSDASVPVPERLGEMNVKVWVTRSFTSATSLSVFAQPGYYGDFAHVTWRTFNAPVTAMVAYIPSPQYSFIFGASYNQFRKYRAQVMPEFGFQWKFAGAWWLYLGFPHSGVMWQATKAFRLGAGASWRCDDYRTTEEPNNTNHTDLANTFVSYREIRLGVRAVCAVAKKVNITLESGWMAERRFRYYERGFTLRGRPSAYMTFGADVKM